MEKEKSKWCQVCHTYTVIQDYHTWYEGDGGKEHKSLDGSHCTKCGIKYIFNLQPKYR